MSAGEQTVIRRLGPGDEDVVRKLADDEPQIGLLADDATIFLAAFRGAEPVGFVFGYELPSGGTGPLRSCSSTSSTWTRRTRRQGIGGRLMRELAEIARSRGVSEGFVLTEPENDAANALYRSLEGERVETVMWDFRYTDG